MPGPGKYHPKQDYIKPRALDISMNNASRLDRSNIQSRQGDQSFFDKSVTATPGPGQYTAKSTLTKRGVAFTKAAKNKNTASRHQIDKASFPGPGAFDPDPIKNRDRPRSALILTSERPSPIKAANVSPGPSAYGKITTGF